MSAEPADDADLDTALRALADGNRRAILKVLQDGPRPVSVVAKGVGLSQQTTSHHLGVLRKAHLAAGTREGTRHLFAINTDGITAVHRYLDDFWPGKLASLKAAVENDGDRNA
ncbi:metalloregulator ArsR/SmtB family transcription factor [Arthrobacter sp. H5]|uniref:ArsR/SmtB family transcription factor n=1 Tax=Arthrobacter sp. H5 TaxID=1267973 RepID=UPI000484CA2B|nr:metalloregulator ArsR/SmtB family transcription factor [Arthrobacter sp. H5]